MYVETLFLSDHFLLNTSGGGISASLTSIHRYWWWDGFSELHWQTALQTTFNSVLIHGEKRSIWGLPTENCHHLETIQNRLNIRASLHGNLLQGSSLTCKSGHHAQTILELWKCRRNAVGLKQLDKHRSQMKQELKYKNADGYMEMGKML